MRIVPLTNNQRLVILSAAKDLSSVDRRSSRMDAGGSFAPLRMTGGIRIGEKQVYWQRSDVLKAVRLAQFDPGADNEAPLEFPAGSIEFGGPLDRAEEAPALLAGMQIEVIGDADLRQTPMDRAEALVDDRRHAIAREIGMQMIVVWKHLGLA